MAVCYAQVAEIKTGGLAVSDIIGGVACKEPCLLSSLLMHVSMPTANYHILLQFWVWDLRMRGNMSF